MNMNLYHVARSTDAEAVAAYHEVEVEVRAAGGALWLSLSQGVGLSYLVIALPVGVSLDRLEGAQPVASVDATEVARADHLFALPAPAVPVVEETPDDEQSPVAR